MKNYRKIIAMILLSVIVLTSFTGCGKGKEAVNIYTQLQNLSNTEKFDFEVNAKFYVKKTENVEIETPTDEQSTQGSEPTEPTTTPVETTPVEETTVPVETTTIAEGETIPTEKENEETDNAEDIIINDTTKTELITTETDYNLRLIGTYLGQNEWSTKVFIKDANTKGYTNITNIYRKDKDIYVDAYSMIDSLDFLLEANGAILNQFDFSKGNVIKTDINTLLEIAKSENVNRNSQLPDIIKVISTDLCNMIEKAGYDVSVIDSAFDSAIEIASEVAQSIEAKANEGNTEKDKEVFSFISQDENGYNFTLTPDKDTTKQFIKNFGEALNKDLSTKMQAYADSEKEKETKEDSEDTEKSNSTTAIQNFISKDENWIKDYGKEIAASVDESKINFTNNFNTVSKDDKETIVITFSYDKENENIKETNSVNIKINKTNTESIELPTKILSDITINTLHDNAKTVISSFLAGTLENEDNDMTPEKMISIGKLVKPSQNDDFKYKIFDRYISISEYIGKDTTVNIPDTIEGLPVFIIEESAFAKNEIVTSISMTDNIVQIDKSAFEGCKNLTSLTLSKNLNDISDNMCRDCESLKNITIHHGIKSIGANAFNNCNSFTEIAIPSTVGNIGMGAFQKCQNAKTILVMDGTLYDEEGTYIKTIGLNIEGSAFSGHRATTIILPQTVIAIDSTAFTPDHEEPPKTMYYSYSPSQLNTLCAKEKYLFTSISIGGELDKAIKSDMNTALKVAKAF